MKKGDVVRVRVFGGGETLRRVWATEGGGVQVCSESEWQRHVETDADPLWVGWPPEDVLAAVPSGDVPGQHEEATNDD